jgi:uncharacterized membrane protein
MSQLVLGLVLFLGAHSISIIAPGWRDATAQRLGVVPWQGIYSVVSFVGFLLMLRGYADARLDPQVLYLPPVGLRHVTGLLMLPVFPLLLAAYLPGRIKSALQHPMLLGTIIWAAAHLLSNGTLADVTLFGAFLVWAVADRLSFRKRVARPVRGAPPSPLNDAIAIIGGLVLYGLFVAWAHQRLFGVAPFG